ncbi:OmpA family protein [Haliangium sp.]|uniref:OmpA family protein n=1 Tax=Haliangium sp. TaxID=2663208 RepID=UPI003D14BDB2
MPSPMTPRTPAVLVPSSASSPVRPHARAALLWLGALALVLVAACGSTGPTPELVNARKAYEEAANSKAKKLVPDRLLTAEQALTAAERAENDEAGSTEARTLAYVAERKARLSQVYARILAAERAKAEAREAYERELEARHEEAVGALDRTSDRLEDTYGQLTEREKQLIDRERELARREQELAARTRELEQRDKSLAERDQTLAQRDKALAAERAARVAAEKRYKAALASLEQIAQVKEEKRGTVLTLSGAVLFRSGKTELLPVAREQLADVARALRDVDEDKRIVVEGHTDSRGSSRSNQRLSRKRAEAVRRFLISEGVPRKQISAEGKGEEVPIADNDTAEGRANNRRVEIVISDGR